MIPDPATCCQSLREAIAAQEDLLNIAAKAQIQVDHATLALGACKDQVKDQEARVSEEAMESSADLSNAEKRKAAVNNALRQNGQLKYLKSELAVALSNLATAEADQKDADRRLRAHQYSMTCWGDVARIAGRQLELETGRAQLAANTKYLEASRNHLEARRAVAAK